VDQFYGYPSEIYKAEFYKAHVNTQNSISVNAHRKKTTKGD
jgi:hypothetical protein